MTFRANQRSWIGKKQPITQLSFDSEAFGSWSVNCWSRFLQVANKPHWLSSKLFVQAPQFRSDMQLSLCRVHSHGNTDRTRTKPHHLVRSWFPCLPNFSFDMKKCRVSLWVWEVFSQLCGVGGLDGGLTTQRKSNLLPYFTWVLGFFGTT